MRPAVVCWSWLSYSESFILDHFRSLGEAIFIEGQPPRAVSDPRPYKPGWLHLLRRFVARYFWEPRPAAMKSRYVRLFQGHKIDVVLAEYGPTGVHCASACRACEIPLVVHFHGFDLTSSASLARYADAYRVILPEAAAVVVVSQPMLELAIRLGARRERLALIPCGVDCERIRPCSPVGNEKRLLYVGRFVPKKAPDLMLRAFARTLARVPQARLVLVGDGELLPRCRSLARALGLGDSVSFLGVLSPDRVLEEMRRARAVILFCQIAPDGNSEGSPVTLMEAGACGLPVVSTRHGGVPEIVSDEVTGLLCEPGDQERFSDSCVRLLLDPELAGRLGQAARQRVESLYSQALAIEKLKAVLQKAGGT